MAACGSRTPSWAGKWAVVWDATTGAVLHRAEQRPAKDDAVHSCRAAEVRQGRAIVAGSCGLGVAEIALQSGAAAARTSSEE